MFGSVVTSKPDADGKRCVDKVIIVIYHLYFKWPPGKDGNVRFTMVPLKVLPNKEWIRYQRTHSLKYLKFTTLGCKE